MSIYNDYHDYSHHTSDPSQPYIVVRALKCPREEKHLIVGHLSISSSTLLKPVLCIQQLLVVTMVVLTERAFRLSLIISQLLAKAIPVRGAKFRKSRLRQLKRDFCFLALYSIRSREEYRQYEQPYLFGYRAPASHGTETSPSHRSAERHREKRRCIYADDKTKTALISAVWPYQNAGKERYSGSV